MTLRIKVSHEELESAWKLVVTNNYDNVETIIQPGGSHVFLIHSGKDITIKEVLTEKNEEPESSPS